MRLFKPSIANIQLSNELVHAHLGLYLLYLHGKEINTTAQQSFNWVIAENKMKIFR